MAATGSRHVDAVTIAGLAPLHFVRLRVRAEAHATERTSAAAAYASKSARGSLLHRARWLAHGVGTPTAALAAARALLAERAPHILVAADHVQADASPSASLLPVSSSSASSSSSPPTLPPTHRPQAQPNDPTDTTTTTTTTTTSEQAGNNTLADDRSVHPTTAASGPHTDNMAPASNAQRQDAAPADLSAAFHDASDAPQTGCDRNHLVAFTTPASGPGAAKSNNPSQIQKTDVHSTQHSLPDLWLFAANPDDLSTQSIDPDNTMDGNATSSDTSQGTSASSAPVVDFLSEAFDVVETGIWNGKHHGHIVTPLLAAMRDHVAALVESIVGAVRLGPDVLFLPADRLVYRLILDFNHSADLLLRVVVYRADSMRPLSSPGDLDAPTPTQVLISPLAILAVLPPHPRVAGDALATAVMARWTESALLPRADPTTSQHDTAVVFVDLGDDVVLPVPKICLVAIHGKSVGKNCLVDTHAAHSTPDAVSNLCARHGTGNACTARDFAENIVKDIRPVCKSEAIVTDATTEARAPIRTTSSVWRSRKRPRSPSSQIEALELAAEKDAAALSAQIEANANALSEKARLMSTLPLSSFPGDDGEMLAIRPTEEPVPTPWSITRAIVVATGLGSPPTPAVLYHPLSKGTTERSIVNDVDLTVIANDIIREEDVQADANRMHDDGAAKQHSHPIDSSQAADQQGIQKCNPRQRGSNDLLVENSDEFDDFCMNSPDLLSSDDPNGGMGMRNNGSGSGGAGGGLDMDELCAFDDDVTQFFAVAESNMLPTSSLVDSVAGIDLPGVATGSTAQEERKSERTLQSPMDLENKEAEDISNGPESAVPFSVCGGWLADGLACLDTPPPEKRPNTPEREKQLQAFLKEDIELRFTVSRRLTSDPYLVSIRKTVALFKPPRHGEIIVQLSGKTRSGVAVAPGDTYVPRRKIHLFREEVSHGGEGCLGSDPDDASSDDTSEESEDDVAEVEICSHKASPCNVVSPDEKNRHDASYEGLQSKPEFDAKTILNGLPFYGSQKSWPQSWKSSIALAAVDCASACYILFAKSLQPTRSGNVFDLSVANLSNTLRAGPESGSNPLSATMRSPADGNIPRSGSLGHHLPVHAATVDRAESFDGRKDGDFLAMFSLLQMQVIGAPELHLIPPKPLRISCKRQKWDGQIGDGELFTSFSELEAAACLCPAPASLSRRALFGLPRLVEWGAFFKSLNAVASVDSDQDRKRVLVSGPPSRLREVMLPNSLVTRLDSPQICVGFDGNWIETPSNILPLWEKSGLEPYADVKNVHYAVLAPKDLAEDVRAFFRDVSAAYEECSMGRHSPMPFDAVSLIGNSVPNDSNEYEYDTDIVTLAEERMIQQYHLSATGLAAKLTAVSKDARSGDSLGPNFVIYVVSPFLRQRRCAIAALLQAVTPLMTCVSSSVVQVPSVSSIPSVLVSMPWRQSATIDGSIAAPSPVMNVSQNSSPLTCSSSLGLSVRVLPWEAVERCAVKSAHESNSSSKVLLRPQLVKAVAFAVYTSLRTKRLRRGVMDPENVGIGSSGEHSDELLSPMTPDVVPVGSPSGALAPGSPLPYQGPGDDTTVLNLPPLGTCDQALSSFLYDPPVVLAGVGQHIGQNGPDAEIVFHLAYMFVESHACCLFAWTDSRGEILDVAGMHMTSSSSDCRTKLFSRIWNRGQRWWVPYADNTCVTVLKIGESMRQDELADWETVVCQFIACTNVRLEESSDPVMTRIRFPNHRAGRAIVSEAADAIKDVATPATPAPAPSSAPVVAFNSTKPHHSPPEHSRDVAATTLRSVSILTMIEHEFPDVFACESKDELLVVSDGQGEIAAVAHLVVEDSTGDTMRQIEIALLSHFGHDEDSSPCLWDSSSEISIMRHVATNYNALRTAGAAPCWPLKRWRSAFPLHVVAVWNLRNLLVELSPSPFCK